MNSPLSAGSTCALALTLLISSAAFAHSTETPGGTFEIQLSSARTSSTASGRLVITADASGDLPGLLTLTLDVVDGIVAGGEWALVVSYVEDLDVPAHDHRIEHEAGEGAEQIPHQEHIRLVDKGTLGGSVTGGHVSYIGGSVDRLTDVQLSIESSSLTFEGIRAGGGPLSFATLASSGSQGRASLTF
jgi:hypothetical protein